MRSGHRRTFLLDRVVTPVCFPAPVSPEIRSAGLAVEAAYRSHHPLCRSIVIGIAIVLLATASAHALAQSPPSLPEAQGSYAPTGPAGPIVGGRRIQPTQSDIIDREALRRPGRPPGRGPDPTDKELDDLYEELMRRAQPQH